MTFFSGRHPAIDDSVIFFLFIPSETTCLKFLTKVDNLILTCALFVKNSCMFDGIVKQSYLPDIFLAVFFCPIIRWHLKHNKLCVALEGGLEILTIVSCNLVIWD